MHYPVVPTLYSRREAEFPSMQQRTYNFSPGPAVLPLPVLERAKEELLCLPGAGASVMELSHRSSQFESVLSQTEQNLRKLLGVPDSYKVLFMQGGARLQFNLIPMNLLRGQRGPAQYVVTGSWGKYASEEAGREGAGQVVWDAKSTNYDRTPGPGEIPVKEGAAYVHITSNETIQGVQFPIVPQVGDAPLVTDCSSEILSRPMDVSKYGLIYACAQKNAGISGVTVVIIREDLLARSPSDLPGMMSYKTISENGSMYNTPPTFAIYILKLITEWLANDIGGVPAMEKLNQEKAALLYQKIDTSGGFYLGHAVKESRSVMNVPFKLAKPELEKTFVADAEKAGLSTLGGHRSVGGMRASIYNAMPRSGVEALCQFMEDFKAKHG